jgi:hypothetical protein
MLKRRSEMTDENRTELDADGRHWIAISRGTRVGGFKTQEDALRFLDNSTVPIVFVDEDRVELWGPNRKN